MDYSKKYNFNDLFVFDMANNHQGDLDHALKIVNEIGQISQKKQIKGVMKFQFRELDTFIHPKFKTFNGNDQIKRFTTTRLEASDFKVLYKACKKNNLTTMCTPFDESSVDLITEMKFDLIKVASCSAKDWPLLEKISESNLPIIFSTGGLTISEIDDLVSFFDHKGCDYAIMHCVSIYPTPNIKCNLNQIDVLKNRYIDKTIGWSTHEDPDNYLPITIALSKGARMFERHVGIETSEIILNKYSSTPDQIEAWIDTYQISLEICGDTDRYLDVQEKEALDKLRRGVFVNKKIMKNTTINYSDIYFAIPFEEGQLTSGSWKEGLIAQKQLNKDDSILMDDLFVPEKNNEIILKNAVHKVKALLNEARVYLNSEFEVEYSHHYGLEKFEEYGAVIINCINREYCKKILVQIAGQKHPAHYHPLKEESFQLLYGDLSVSIDGHIKKLSPGETCLVMPGVWHSFWTEGGCVFEEVSTTHFNSDSVYKDSKINKLLRNERKTIVDHWGRFQIPKIVNKDR